MQSRVRDPPTVEPSNCRLGGVWLARFGAGGLAIVLLAGCAGTPPPLTASPEPTAEATPHAAGTPVRETGGSAPTTVPTQRAVDTHPTPKSDPGTMPHGDSRSDTGGSSSLLRGASLDDDAATPRGPSTPSTQVGAGA